MHENERIYQLALRTFTPEGTLESAAKLLPHIASCGFTHVQLTPVNESDGDTDKSCWSRRLLASGTENPYNNYRLKDYYLIDPEYGTDEDLDFFVRYAHKIGLKVILDLVYYHCGPNSTLVTVHPEYIQHNDDGSLKTGEWRMPVLDYSNRELCEYMWDNMVYFIRQFDIDGYRCDSGDLVPLSFWTEGIRRCRALKSDFFMINEGNNPEYLTVFDCCYFWKGRSGSVKIPLGEVNADEWAAAWQTARERLPQSGGRLLHFLENHDICSDAYDNRLEKVLGHDAMDVLHVLIYTLDGTPFVFNGNEFADEVKHSMFSNRFYGGDDTLPWNLLECEQGKNRMNLIVRLNKLRDDYDALNTKELQWVPNSCPSSVVSFIRPAAKESVFVILNLRSEPITVDTSFHAPVYDELLTHVVHARVNGSGTEIQMPGYGYWVIAYN